MRKGARYGLNKLAGSAAAGYIALRMAKKLKRLVNVERKYLIYTNNINVPDTGTIYFLSGVPQGDTSSSRDGNKCKALSLNFHAQVTIDTNAVRSACRIILFKDKSSNGSAPAVLDVLENATYLYSYNNVNCPYRFQILFDKTFSLSTTGTQTINVKRFIKMGHHITYKGTGATQSDAADGHIYMLVISNETTNQPDLEVNSRLTFVDN